MTDEKTPQVGDEAMYWDEDGDPVVGSISETGAMNAETGNYSVLIDGVEGQVYWSDADDMWIDASTEIEEE